MILKKWTTIILLFSASFAFAYETGVMTQFGNYGLSEYDQTDTSYIPYFQWASSAYFKETAGIDENLAYGFELSRDPLVGYSLSSKFSFIQPYYSISFGPIFGIINESLSLIKPGFSGAMRGEWPGRAFAELGGDSIPSQYTGSENDYSMHSAYYSIGFYLNQSHILCYFTQSVKNYSSLSGSTPYTNNLVEYIFSTDFFEKGSIFKLKSKLGYEILTKTFFDESTIELQNILFGLQADFFINTSATVFFGIDNKIFPTSYGSIELGSVPFYLVSIQSGFKWSI